MFPHALIRRSTAALIVMVLIAAAYSLSMAQGVLPENKWQDVTPMLLPANMAGTGVKIKVGQSYKFVDYGAAEQARLGVQYIWRPREANAKRVLVVYDINSFSAKDWITIDEATPPDRDPPLAALLMAIDYGVYIGTPIKWNKQFGDTMRAAVSLEEQFPAIKASEAMKVLADDVLSHAANNQAIKMAGASWDETISNFKRAGIQYTETASGWTAEEMQLMKAGNPGPIKAKQPENPIYIAFDREFEDLSVEPIGRVISVSGVGGERLGYKHPAWPLEKSK